MAIQGKRRRLAREILGLVTRPKSISTEPPSSVAPIATSILRIRGVPVLLDNVLASLYGVPTKRLNEQVKRNSARFPEDFAFRLTSDEVEFLNRSQIATGSQRHRDPRHPPLAFTEHGAIMAATVLNSTRAIETGVFVVRAFVQMRRLVRADSALLEKINELETRLEKRLAIHDRAIAETIDAIKKLMAAPATRRRPIGFTADLNSQI